MCRTGSACWSTSPNSSRSASEPSWLDLAGAVLPAIADGGQGALGAGAPDAVLPGEVPFGVVGLQQAARCPALDLCGELPAEVDRIEQAGVQRQPEDVRGVAGEQDAAGQVAVGQPAVPDEPAQPLRAGHRQVAAEHPPGAGSQFVQGHRCAEVGRRVVLARVDDVDARRGVLVQPGQRRERVGCLAGCGLAPRASGGRARAPSHCRRRSGRASRSAGGPVRCGMSRWRSRQGSRPRPACVPGCARRRSLRGSVRAAGRRRRDRGHRA